jgi:hypothetical protein
VSLAVILYEHFVYQVIITASVRGTVRADAGESGSPESKSIVKGLQCLKPGSLGWRDWHLPS